MLYGLEHEKKDLGLGNKRLSIRVPSFEKEKEEKLAKNTQKAVFITIL